MRDDFQPLIADTQIFSQYYGRDSWKYEKKEVTEANSLLGKNGILATIDIEDVQYYLENIFTTRDKLVKNMPLYCKTQCVAEVSSLLKTELAKTLSIPRESIITIYIVTETDKGVGVPKGSLTVEHHAEDGHRTYKSFSFDDYALGVACNLPQMRAREQI